MTLAAGKKARLSGWIALIWLGVLQVAAHAQTVALPARSVDPGIPSIESVIGHAPGTEITSPDDVLKWFRTLAGAAPVACQPTHLKRVFSERWTMDGTVEVAIVYLGNAPFPVPAPWSSWKLTA